MNTFKKNNQLFKIIFLQFKKNILKLKKPNEYQLKNIQIYDKHVFDVNFLSKIKKRFIESLSKTKKNPANCIVVLNN